MEPTHIEHPLEPIFDARSRVLVLGTMPSPKSREAGFYYAHPQNRFWKVMAALFEEPEPLGNEARAAFMLERRVALWDVLASCTIEGASDASISNARPNDLSHRLGRAARSRVHHGIEGDGALPALLCRHASGRAARGPALHEPRERPHAPGRPRGGVPAAPGRAAPKRLSPGALACATAGRQTFRQSYHRLPRPVAREAADAGRRQAGAAACERSYFSAFSGWPWSFCQRSQVE